MTDQYVAADIAIRVRLLNETGGTLSLSGQPLPLDGFWVGGDGEERVFESVADVTFPPVLDFLTGLHSHWVGFWVDGETGRVHLDGVTWCALRGTAELLGRQRGELAIRDIANNRDLRFVYVEGEAVRTEV